MNTDQPWPSPNARPELRELSHLPSKCSQTEKRPTVGYD